MPTTGTGNIRTLFLPLGQEAINFLTECVWAKSPHLYTPTKLWPNYGTTSTFDFQQVATPMVHPTTGETIVHELFETTHARS
jgi:hypothetical protein